MRFNGGIKKNSQWNNITFHAQAFIKLKELHSVPSMSYSFTDDRISAMLFRSHSCPFLIAGVHCAGGDYCPYPEGEERLCCFYCGKLDNCPDKTGICIRLKED